MRVLASLGSVVAGTGVSGPPENSGWHRSRVGDAGGPPIGAVRMVLQRPCVWGGFPRGSISAWSVAKVASATLVFTWTFFCLTSVVAQQLPPQVQPRRPEAPRLQPPPTAPPLQVPELRLPGQAPPGAESVRFTLKELSVQGVTV